MNLCKKLIDIYDKFDTWVHPVEIEKPDCVLQLLMAIYPSVNWSKVHFYNSLPWFIPSSQASAITLPGTSDFLQIHIYFNKNFDPCSCRGLGTIVHEGFHVLQYTNIGTFGVGFIRLFMMEYFGCWIINGYENNPMEIAAYAQEKHFRDCCNMMTEKICDCSKKFPVFNQHALSQLLVNCPDLIRENSQFKYHCGFIALYLGFLLDILIAILITATQIVLDILGLLLLFVVSVICGVVGLWNIIFTALTVVCNWTIKWEKECRQWARQTIQECKQYRDNGYNACSSYRDAGYNACNTWAEQGYNSCCTWWPCSWGCKAFVWISNVVCIGWYWITNLVCISWYWISSWVCICWATLVKWICTATAWVIKKITCW